MSIEKIIENYKEKVKELQSDVYFDDNGETETHEFGFKYEDKEENGHSTIHTVVDFGNIESFLRTSLEEYGREVINKCIEALPKPEKQDDDDFEVDFDEQCIAYEVKGSNECLEEVKEILNNLK